MSTSNGLPIRENDADIKMVDVGKLPRFPAAILHSKKQA